MIKLKDIRYVRMGTTDVDTAVKTCTKTIGLEMVRREGDTAYLRGDDRDHNIVYFKGDPKDHTVGFEVDTAEELKDAERALKAAGLAVARGDQAGAQARRVMDYVNFKDPSGNSIDLVLRPFHSGVRYFGGRDAGIQEFSHIGMNTTDPPRDEKFWTTMFNMRVNDRLGIAPLISFDEVHHRVALFPNTGPGVQHINFQVDGIDDVLKSYYFMQEHQVLIRWGPGRHPLSSAMFLYFQGPENMTYEYSHGVRLLPPGCGWRERQFPFDRWSLCYWGAIPNMGELKAAAS